VKVHSQIVLDVRQSAIPYHHPDALAQLEKALTFDNPKWKEANHLGFSTWAIEKTICLIERTSYGFWLIPRGHIRTVLEVFPDEEIVSEVRSVPNQSVFYSNEDFELDERQRRCLDAIKKKSQGLILAATSAGKSAIILAAIAKLKENALVIVNRQVLLDQLVADAKKYLSGTTIGILSGKKKQGGQVTFAIDKTLENLLRQEDEKARNSPNDPTLLRNSFGAVFHDESHSASTPTMKSILNRLPARYRYGFTGCLKRRDGLQFFVYGLFGQVIATVGAEELKEAGRITPVTPVVHRLVSGASEAIFGLEGVEKWRAFDSFIHKDQCGIQHRFDLVLSIVLKILLERPAARILILSRYIAPCKKGADFLTQNGIKTGVIIGENANNTALLQSLDNGDIRVAFSTISVTSTGINVKTLSDIILFSPILNNELLLTQIRGRLMRVSPLKNHSYMHIIWDEGCYPQFKLKRLLQKVTL